jgi:tRNA(adenine34) deaminase
MQEAIAEAGKSGTDIPIGCVIAKNGKIIASANNRRERENDITAHAEILAIKQAQKVLGTSRLNECEMYVTLEPCPMCAWAIVQSGINTLYFGSYNIQYGAIESVVDLTKLANSKIKVYGGIMQEECDNILEKFFYEIRRNKL